MPRAPLEWGCLVSFKAEKVPSHAALLSGSGAPSTSPWLSSTHSSEQPLGLVGDTSNNFEKCVFAILPGDGEITADLATARRGQVFYGQHVRLLHVASQSLVVMSLRERAADKTKMKVKLVPIKELAAKTAGSGAGGSSSASGGAGSGASAPGAPNAGGSTAGDAGSHQQQQQQQHQQQSHQQNASGGAGAAVAGVVADGSTAVVAAAAAGGGTTAATGGTAVVAGSGDVETRFRIMPRYRIRNEGQKVLVGDAVVLSTAGSASPHFLHVSQTASSDGGEGSIHELHVSPTSSSGFQIELYAAPDESKVSIRASDYVSLVHLQEASLVSCVGLGADQRIVGDAVAGVALAGGSLRATSVWLVESEDPFVGGAVRCGASSGSTACYRLKCLLSGRYLAVQRVSAALVSAAAAAAAAGGVLDGDDDNSLADSASVGGFDGDGSGPNALNASFAGSFDASTASSSVMLLQQSMSGAMHDAGGAAFELSDEYRLGLSAAATQETLVRFVIASEDPSPTLRHSSRVFIEFPFAVPQETQQDGASAWLSVSGVDIVHASRGAGNEMQAADLSQIARDLGVSTTDARLRDMRGSGVVVHHSPAHRDGIEIQKISNEPGGELSELAAVIRLFQPVRRLQQLLPQSNTDGGSGGVVTFPQIQVIEQARDAAAQLSCLCTESPETRVLLREGNPRPQYQNWICDLGVFELALDTVERMEPLLQLLPHHQRDNRSSSGVTPSRDAPVVSHFHLAPHIMTAMLELAQVLVRLLRQVVYKSPPCQSRIRLHLPRMYRLVPASNLGVKDALVEALRDNLALVQAVTRRPSADGEAEGGAGADAADPSAGDADTAAGSGSSLYFLDKIIALVKKEGRSGAGAAMRLLTAVTQCHSRPQKAAQDIACNVLLGDLMQSTSPMSRRSSSTTDADPSTSPPRRRASLGAGGDDDVEYAADDDDEDDGAALPASAAASSSPASGDTGKECPWFFRLLYQKPRAGARFTGVYIDAPVTACCAPLIDGEALQPDAQPPPAPGFMRFEYFMVPRKKKSDDDPQQHRSTDKARRDGPGAASGADSGSGTSSSRRAKLVKPYLGDNKALQTFARQLEAEAAIVNEESAAAILALTPVDALLALVRFPFASCIDGRVRGHTHRLLRVLLCALAPGRVDVIAHMHSIGWVLDSGELGRQRKERDAAARSKAAAAAAAASGGIGGVLSALGLASGGGGRGGGGGIAEDDSDQDDETATVLLGPTRPLRPPATADGAPKLSADSAPAAAAAASGTAAVDIEMTPREPIEGEGSNSPAAPPAAASSSSSSSSEGGIGARSYVSSPLLPPQRRIHEFPPDEPVRLYFELVVEYLSSQERIVVDDSSENFSLSKTIKSVQNFLTAGFVGSETFAQLVGLLSRLLDGTRDTLSKKASVGLGVWNRYEFDERNYYVVSCKLEIVTALHQMSSVVEFERACEVIRDFEATFVYLPPRRGAAAAADGEHNNNGDNDDDDDDDDDAFSPAALNAMFFDPAVKGTAAGMFILPHISPLLPLGAAASSATALHASSHQLYAMRRRMLEAEEEAARRAKSDNTSVMLSFLTSNLAELDFLGMTDGPSADDTGDGEHDDDDDNGADGDGGGASPASSDDGGGGAPGDGADGKGAKPGGGEEATTAVRMGLSADKRNKKKNQIALTKDARQSYSALHALLRILCDSMRYQYDPLVESATALFLRLTDAGRVLRLLQSARFVPSARIAYYRRALEATNVVDAAADLAANSGFARQQLFSLVALLRELLSGATTVAPPPAPPSSSSSASGPPPLASIDASAVSILVNLSFHVRVAQLLVALVRSSAGGGMIMPVAGSAPSSPTSRRLAKAENVLRQFIDACNEFLIVVLSAATASAADAQAALAVHIGSFVKCAALCPQSTAILLERILRGNDLCLTVTDTTIADLATAIGCTAPCARLARVLRTLVYQETQSVSTVSPVAAKAGGAAGGAAAVFNTQGVFVANQAPVLDALLAVGGPLRSFIRCTDLLSDADLLRRMAAEDGDLLREESELYFRHELLLAAYYGVQRRDSTVKAMVRGALFGEGGGAFEAMIACLEATQTGCPLLGGTLLRIFNEVFLDDTAVFALAETELFARAVAVIAGMLSTSVDLLLADDASGGSGGAVHSVPPAIQRIVAELQRDATFAAAAAPQQQQQTEDVLAAASASSRKRKSVAFSDEAERSANPAATATSPRLLFVLSPDASRRAAAAAAPVRAALCHDSRDMLIFRVFVVLLPVVRSIVKNFFDSRGATRLSREATQRCRAILFPAFAKLAHAVAHSNVNFDTAVSQIARLQEREAERERLTALAVAAALAEQQQSSGKGKRSASGGGGGGTSTGLVTVSAADGKAIAARVEEELDRTLPLRQGRWALLADSLRTPTNLFFCIDERGALQFDLRASVALSNLPPVVLQTVAECVAAARAHHVPLFIEQKQQAAAQTPSAAAAIVPLDLGPLQQLIVAIAGGSRAAAERAILLSTHHHRSGRHHGAAGGDTDSQSTTAAGGNGNNSSSSAGGGGEDMIDARFQAAVRHLLHFSETSPYAVGDFRVSAAAMLLLGQTGHHHHRGSGNGPQRHHHGGLHALDTTAALRNICRRVLRDSPSAFGGSHHAAVRAATVAGTEALRADTFHLFRRILDASAKVAKLSDAMLLFAAPPALQAVASHAAAAVAAPASPLFSTPQTPTPQSSSFVALGARNASEAAAAGSTSALDDAAPPLPPQQQQQQSSLDEGGFEARSAAAGAAAAASSVKAAATAVEASSSDDDDEEEESRRLTLAKSLEERQNIVSDWSIADASCLPPKTVAYLGAQPELVLASLRAACVALHDGNGRAQRSIAAYFESTTNESFFEQARSLLVRTKNTLHERGAVLARIARYAAATGAAAASPAAAATDGNATATTSKPDGADGANSGGDTSAAAAGSGGKGGSASAAGTSRSVRRTLLDRVRIPKYTLAFDIAVALLRCIQLLCENHNESMQHLMREQDNIGQSINLLNPVLEVIDIITSSGVDDDTAPVLIQAIRTLAETCQGPCYANCRTVIQGNGGQLLTRLYQNNMTAHPLCAPELLLRIRREAAILLQSLLEPLSGRSAEHFSLVVSLCSTLEFAPIVECMDLAYSAWRETDSGFSITRKLAALAPDFLKPLGPYLRPAFGFFRDILSMLFFHQSMKRGGGSGGSAGAVGAGGDARRGLLRPGLGAGILAMDEEFDDDEHMDLVCRIASFLMTLVDIADVAYANGGGGGVGHTKNQHNALQAAVALVPDSQGERIVALLRRSRGFKKVWGTHVVSVEVAREVEGVAKIERIYFRRPARMALLSAERKEALLDELPIWQEGEGDLSRLEEFLYRADRVMQELEYYEQLSRDRILSVIFKYQSLLEKIAVLVSFIINIILLFGAHVDNDNEPALLGAETQGHYTRLGELLLVVQVMQVAVFFFGDLQSELSAQWSALTRQLNVSRAEGDRITQRGRAVIDDARAVFGKPRRLLTNLVFFLSYPLTYRYFFFTIVSFIAYAGNPAAYALQPLYIVFFIPTLSIVLSALTATARNLAVLFLFAVTVLFVFAAIAFYSFSSSFAGQEGLLGNADSLFGVFTRACLTRGLLLGGGFGEAATLPQYSTDHNAYSLRLFYDFAFFVLVIVLLLQLARAPASDLVPITKHDARHRLASARASF